MSVCVPAPVHLFPCPSVSLFLFVCVPDTVRQSIFLFCPYVSLSALTLFLSLSMSVSVPVLFRLCPCPSVSLSAFLPVCDLSLFLPVCVPVPLPVCLCPCPLVSLSLSVCVLVPIFCVPVPDRCILFPVCVIFRLCTWVSFAMLFFHRLLWKQITFNAYLLP
jgi:hypothetical protein